MKSPADISGAVLARLRRTWHLDATGRGCSWPYTIRLGSYSAAELAAEFPATREKVQELREWVAAHDLAMSDSNRRVLGTTQPIPTHVTIGDVDTAARLVGKAWVDRLRRGRARSAALAERYPDCASISKAVRARERTTCVELTVAGAVWRRGRSSTRDASRGPRGERQQGPRR